MFPNKDMVAILVYQTNKAHVSDLSQNCQHELYGIQADKIKLYIVIRKESVKSENFSFVLFFFS